MNKAQLLYKGFSVVFQEVPNEISLAINIYGCPHHCEGCHSNYLWDSSPIEDARILYDDIPQLLNNYKDLISCVCFMGGDWQVANLIQCISLIKKIDNTLKICVYSGEDTFDKISQLIPYLDYLKIGSYNKYKGGLNSPTTNQKFFTVKSGELIDITQMFYNKVII